MLQRVTFRVIFTLSKNQPRTEQREQNELPEICLNGRSISACKARIISLICYGLTRDHIAEVMGVKQGTIGSHLDTLYKYLGIPGSKALIARALTSGFDLEGNYHGHYLFEGYTKVPWLNGGKVRIDRTPSTDA